MIRKINKYVTEVKTIVKKRKNRFVDNRSGSVRTTCSIDSYSQLLPTPIQVQSFKTFGHSHSIPEFV